jgi:hypothetical protein
MASPGSKSIKDYLEDYYRSAKSRGKEWWSCCKKTAKDRATLKMHEFSEHRRQAVGRVREGVQPYTSLPKHYWDRATKTRNDYLFKLSLPVRTNALALITLGVFIGASRGRIRKTVLMGLGGAFLLTPELANPFNRR